MGVPTTREPDKEKVTTAEICPFPWCLGTRQKLLDDTGKSEVTHPLCARINKQTNKQTNKQNKKTEQKQKQKNKKQTKKNKTKQNKIKIKKTKQTNKQTKQNKTKKQKQKKNTGDFKCTCPRRAIFDLPFTFFSHREGKVTKIPSAHYLTHIYMYFAHPIDFFKFIRYGFSLVWVLVLILFRAILEQSINNKMVSKI